MSEHDIDDPIEFFKTTIGGRGGRESPPRHGEEEHSICSDSSSHSNAHSEAWLEAAAEAFHTELFCSNLDLLQMMDEGKIDMDVLARVCQRVCDEWSSCEPNAFGVDAIEHALTRFALVEPDVREQIQKENVEYVNTLGEKVIVRIGMLLYCLMKRGDYDIYRTESDWMAINAHFDETASFSTRMDNPDLRNRLVKRLNETKAIVKSLSELLKNAVIGRALLDATRRDSIPPSMLKSEYGLKDTGDTIKMKPTRLGYEYILDVLMRFNYRKRDDLVYMQIFSPPIDGKRYPTHAWQVLCTIEEFVYKALQTDVAPSMFDITFDCKKSIAGHVKDNHDSRFPPVLPDRHVFAFRNGVFDVRTSTVSGMHFYHYVDGDMPPHIVAVKYFDQYFAEELFSKCVDWYDIPTRALQTIVEYQFSSLDKTYGPGSCEEVCRWVYAFIGRMMYDVGECDDWQIIPFFIGVACTGKSKLGEVIGSIYPPENVGVLANNADKRFGLSSIWGKLLWRCFEVKKDFSLDQAQFQSMVTGEDLNLEIKYETGRSVRWYAPGVLIGNTRTSWDDNSGSVSRRILYLFFRKTVVGREDKQLGAKLRAETAAIIRKCATAYAAAYTEFGNKSIWADDVLPKYFHDIKDMFALDSDPLRNYLSRNVGGKLQTGAFTSAENESGVDGVVSDQLSDERIAMPFSRFKKLVGDWVSEENLKPISWRQRMDYQQVLDEYGIQVVRGNKYGLEKYRGTTVRGDWMLGITETEALLELGNGLSGQALAKMRSADEGAGTGGAAAAAADDVEWHSIGSGVSELDPDYDVYSDPAFMRQLHGPKPKEPVVSETAQWLAANKTLAEDRYVARLLQSAESRAPALPTEDTIDDDQTDARSSGSHSSRS